MKAMRKDSMDGSRTEPLPLSDFPGIPFEYIALLRSMGINTSVELLNTLDGPGIGSLQRAGTVIPEARLQELGILAELARIRGIGGMEARILHEAGIRSLHQLAGIRPEELLRRSGAVIREHYQQLIPPSREEIIRWIEEAGIIQSVR